MKVPKEVISKAILDAPNTYDIPSYIAQRAAEWALSQPVSMEPWKHDCAALLMNDVELWIDHCPHCGKPRTASEPVSMEPAFYTATHERWDANSIDTDPFEVNTEHGWHLTKLYTQSQLTAARQQGADEERKKHTHKTTGWVAPKDRYSVPVLFNPYTGEPRDVRDVASDPQGILIVPPGKVEMLTTVKENLTVEANYDEVICPNCVTQFRAIPVNVQQRIAELESENKMLRRADEDRQKCMVKMQADAVKYEDDIANLHTVMMAAAVEITEHWDAHCDSEGYGPTNLVRRLENGYPSQYGYDADTVVRQNKRIAELEKSNAVLLEACKAALSDDQPYIEKCRAAIAAAEVKP